MGIDRQAFGAALNKLRASLGISQAALGQRINVAQAHIADMEAGRRLPGTKILSRLRRATGASIDKLLDASSNGNSP